MAKQEVTGVQVQMAAAAGVKMLQQDDLMVPLSVSKSGALGILEGMLTALANGEVVLTAPPPAAPNPEVAAAVGAAVAADAPPVENISGDGAEAPSAPVESAEGGE